MKKLLCAVLVLALLALPICAFSAGAANTEGERVTSGSNVERQNYNNSNWASTVLSYLVETTKGELMRVQADPYEGKYYVEYYDADYHFLRAFAVKAELPRFGGFYATESNYYILSGQNNPDESPKVECFRVTKYDLNWNRITSVGLYDCNTYIPFDAGSARMTHSGKYLLIRTCHEMYKSSDGYHHQANVTIQVDTNAMKITDSFTDVMNSGVGYVSHSFNQFIRVEDDHIVAVDHGDAYPRSIVLIRYPSKVSSGQFYTWGCEVTNLQTFPGQIGANYTGASVGGFEISGSSYLVAYSSIDQNAAQAGSVRNIYVASMDKQSGKVTVRQITHLAEKDASVSTPHLVKIGENSFVLLWSRNGDVYYTELNGKGEAVGKTYCIKGASLSDCVPLVTNGKLVWYTYQGSEILFYEIDTEDLSENNRNGTYALGDVDGSGTIDATDYLFVKRYVLGLCALSDAQLAAADVSKDGVIDSTDYSMVKRHVLQTFHIG